MDGLEISEIKFSEMFFENRLDSEYFLKDILIKDAILDKLASIKIGSFSYVTDGIHESIEFDDKSNVNLISAKAPKKNYFDLSGTGFISKSQNEQNPRTQLKYNDIVVSTVGTIGNCAVVNEEVLPANSDRHVGIVRLNSDSVVKPRYVSTFILSKYGQYQTKRFTTGNVQPNLFIYKLKDIKVPVISNLWQDKIEGIVLQAEELLKDSKKCYKLAEKLLMDKLNIKIDAIDLISIKTLSNSFEISGRLDAEYYQPKYDNLFDGLKRHNTRYLGGENGLVNIKKSIEPGSEAYQDEGIPFVRVSDVDKFEISNPDIKISKDIVTNIEELYPKKGTILFSKDGSIGIAYKVEENLEVVTSGALLHLTIKETEEILPDYLTLVLNSSVVQLQAERDCNGAIIQHWKPSDIEKVIIPMLDMDKQKEIAEKVRESFRLRKKSKELLDISIKAVEMAIETDEQTALAWLDTQNI